MRRIVFSGETFQCIAKPYPLTWGVGVKIDVSKSGKRIGGALVYCAFNHAAFAPLASLSPSELCELALSRFVAENLSVTLERVLWWQEEIGKLGFDYVSHLGTSFGSENHSAGSLLPVGHRIPRADHPHDPCEGGATSNKPPG